MKKIKILLLTVVVAGFISSCKSREKCPAYGHNVHKTQQARS